jgi:hypothetical protein
MVRAVSKQWTRYYWDKEDEKRMEHGLKQQPFNILRG